MTAFLSHYLKIRSGEGSKVLQFTCLAALLQTGLVCGISTADSLFLAHVGAQGLPMVYLATPLMMFLYVSISTYLGGRYGLNRLFVLALLALIGGCIAFYSATAPGLLLPLLAGNGIVYYLAKLFSTLWYIALYTLYWSFIDSYFDILDARRFFSLFSAGMAAGAMVGGGLVVLLVGVMPVEALFLVWAALSLAVLPLVGHLKRSWPRLVEEDPDLERRQTTIRREMRGIADTLRGSRYTLLLIAVLIIIMVATTMAEFQYMHLFQEGRSDAEVASLFGRLYLVVNGFNLLVNLVVFNRLISRLGAPVVAFIQPAIYLVAFSYLLLDSGLGAALFTFFAAQGILVSVDFNNHNFLFNALPDRTKLQVRTFIEGLCEPLATAAAGLFLLAFAHVMSPQALSAVAMAILAVGILLVLALRAQYMTAMVASLRETWIDFSFFSTARPLPFAAGDLAFATAVAGRGDAEQALTALRLLAPGHPDQALDLLLAFIERAEAAAQEAAAPLLASLLADRDTERFRRTLHWLQGIRRWPAPGLLFCAGRYHLLSPADLEALLRSAVPHHRAVVAVALWYDGTMEGKEEGSRILHGLLAGEPEARAAGVRGLGELDQPIAAGTILALLDEPSSRLRSLAMQAMVHRADQGSGQIIAAILAVIAGGSMNERTTGLTILAQSQDPDIIRPLVHLSETFSPRQRRQAEAILTRIGLAGVPILVLLLKDPSCPFVGKAIVARAFSVLAFPQFAALAPQLISDEIERAYRCLVAGWVLAQDAAIDPGLELLSRYYRDRHRLIVDFVLECLTITGHLPDFEHMAASLRSSQIKERANAIETIERGCGSSVVSRLIPLLRSRSLDEKVAHFRLTFHEDPPHRHTLLGQALASPVPFEQAAGLQAAWHYPEMQEPRQKVLQELLLAPPRQATAQPGGIDLVRHVALSLLGRTYRPEGPQVAAMNLLERALCLSQARFFGSLHIGEIGWLAARAAERQVPADQLLFAQGQPCQEVLLPIAGSLWQKTADNRRPVGAGEVLGFNAFLATACHEETLVSGGARLLVLAGEVIWEAAEMFPHVAMALLAAKMGDLTQKVDQQAVGASL